MKEYLTFYNYPLRVSSAIPLDTEEAMDRHFNHILIRQQLKFESEYSIISKDKAKELIEFHWRHYRRQGGKMVKFIKELKKVNHYRFDPHNRDIFLCFIEDNESAETTKEQEKKVPSTFEEAFTVKDWRKYIDKLTTVENPVLDKDWNYIGSPRKHKGVICNWIGELKQRSIIQKHLDLKH